jgi:hypothetical protein
MLLGGIRISAFFEYNSAPESRSSNIADLARDSNASAALSRTTDKITDKTNTIFFLILLLFPWVSV